MQEFQTATENEALKTRITGRIAREGAISFRDFMAMALYEPGLGYYNSPREKIGRSGDYLTSPEVSPLFGAIIGRQLREMWEALGRPAKFQVVESGAGTGAPCRDILRSTRATDGGWTQAMRYTIVEKSEALVRRQAESLEAEGLASYVEWRPEIPLGTTGCILSNELLDAMPVHMVEVRRGELLEVHVRWDGRRFIEELRAPGPAVTTYFDRLGMMPGEGCRAEVNLGALDWVRSAADALGRGFLLTFDYGYEAPELYAPWRREGTLMCFYRHNPSTDPYARIGRQDITAHVDFTSIRASGEEAGMRTLGLVSQSQFLMNLGLPNALPTPGEGEANLEEYYARRRAVTELIDPGALGRIKVLVQAKGLDIGSLAGLRCREAA